MNKLSKKKAGGLRRQPLWSGGGGGGGGLEMGVFGREDKREESIDEGVVCFKG